MLKWVKDQGATKSINDACSQMGLEELGLIPDTRVRILFNLFNHSFIAGNRKFGEFNRALKRVDESDKESMSDERII